MKTAIHHGQTSIRRGEVGSHVEVHLQPEKDGEWSGVYTFASHGMTPHEFVGRVQAIRDLHRLKTRRLNGFVELRKRDITIGDDVFRVIDCNLFGRGTDYELLVGVARVLGNGEFEQRFKLDHRDGLLYPSLDAVPTDAEIEDMVRSRIEVGETQKAAHASFLASVAAIMGRG